MSAPALPPRARAYLCTPGFERALCDELGGGEVKAPGVVVAAATGGAAVDPVFARQVLPDAVEVSGPSVRALAEAAYAAVEGAIDSWPGPFTLHPLGPPRVREDDADDTAPAPEAGLGSRAALIGRTLLELLGQRRRRARRRYEEPDAPGMAGATFATRAGDVLLVQIVLVTRDRALVSAAAPRPLPRGGTDLSPWPGGEPPVAVDRAPPSRAYQKLEEAFQWMGAAPGPGDRCVDLGAAPGGWTAKALARGAQVVAVDRAPLALPPRPALTAIAGNAFTYEPSQPPVDWMLSDVVAEPARSLALVEAWLTRGWCRNLVVTVKFKGRDGYGALAALPPLWERTAPAFARVKQLAHNKNEVCVMVRAGAAAVTDTGARRK